MNGIKVEGIIYRQGIGRENKSLMVTPKTNPRVNGSSEKSNVKKVASTNELKSTNGIVFMQKCAPKYLGNRPDGV